MKLRKEYGQSINIYYQYGGERMFKRKAVAYARMSSSLQKEKGVIVSACFQLTSSSLAKEKRA